jgi:hypothetical protein
MKDIKVIIHPSKNKVSFDIIINHNVIPYRAEINPEELKDFQKLGTSAYVAMIVGRELQKYLIAHYQ